MLTPDELLSLSHLLAEEQVLSIYIDGTGRDPAQRHAWRVELEHSLDEARQSLVTSPHAERVAFEECVTVLEDRLARIAEAGTIGAPGWVAFITRAGVQLAERVAAPVPTVALWGTGICLTPYVRTLKEARPVVVVVADARKARIYQYGAGALSRAETIQAHALVEAPSHMGDPATAGFHGGTLGETGEAAAQRARNQGTARMVTDVVRIAKTLAGPEGWIIAGGIPRVAAQFVRGAEQVAKGRVVHARSLDVHATDAQILAAAQESASILRDAGDLRRVSDILIEAESGGAAACGAEATRSALEQGSVRELYLTERYFLDHATAAEQAVRAAFAQRAVVEEVSRSVASLLDEHGGICARLRYALASVPPNRAISTGREASPRP